MRDNQTTRRMPMIVTAMACAAASMLAGLALAPSAMAAGATITLNGADGNSLAGHTFNVYQIGTYTDQILNGTQISSLGVRGTTASNAWAADAISIANAYDPSTADDIGKVYGYDDAGNIANIKMDSQTRQLRNISKALSQSTRKPAAIQGGANLTTIVYDGTTQNNAKSIPGDPALKTADNKPADPDLAIPAGGWGIDGRKLLDKYSNRTIVITYRMTVDKASITDPANNTIHTYGTFTDGIHFTTITDQDKADIKAYDFTLRKVDAGNVNTLLDGAQFQIQRNGKWMNLDWNTGKWSDAANQGSATVFVTGDTNHDGTADNRDDASQRGLIRFKGLGYGTYTVTETREPAGYASYAKPTFTVTIDDAGTSIQYRGTGTVPNLTSRLDNNTVQVKNVANLTQLPQTGGVLAFAFWLACAMPLFAIGGTMAVRGARNRRDALMLTHDGDTPAV